MAEPKKTSTKPQELPERPEIAEFLKWKSNGTRIHWQLIDGSTLIGTLNWFDNYNVQVQTDDLAAITIPKHSLLWYRAETEEGPMHDMLKRSAEENKKPRERKERAV